MFKVETLFRRQAYPLEEIHSGSNIRDLSDPFVYLVYTTRIKLCTKLVESNI